MRRRPFLVARERAGQRVTIGFVGIADFRSVIGQEYIAGVTQAAADHGVNLLNFAGAIQYSPSGDADFLTHHLKKYRFLRPPLVDGAVTWASSLGVFLGDEAIRDLHRRLAPLPLVDLGVPLLDGVPGVTIKTDEGIRQVMDHLVGVHGFRRFGFIGGSPGLQYQLRLDAWRAELARFGCVEDPQFVAILENLEAKDLRRWLDALCRRHDLRQRRTLDAFVTVSDLAAATLVEELGRRGLRVPADVAVTGFNNQAQGRTAPCPVTTIDLGYYQRGYAAVELLLDRIEAPEAPVVSRYLPTSLVVRRSCGCFEAEVVAAGAGPEPGGDPADPALDAALAEVAAGRGDGALLGWVQEAWGALEAPDYQTRVSGLRRRALAAAPDAPAAARIEAAFHRLRVLGTLNQGYRAQTRGTDAYRFNALARVAIGLASATTVPLVFEAIRHHLADLEMPGLLLVLQEDLAPDLGAGALELAHPAIPGLETPLRVHEGAFPPRSCFPRDRSWVMMVEILSVGDQFLGFALIEMGPANVALYDAVRDLLSQALGAAYLREGRRPRERDRLLGSPAVAGLLAQPLPSGRGGLSARTVVEYLLDRLDQMTDLDAMSSDLSMSKSYLIRRTRALTGYTVQGLHEFLKIEQAKVLLEARNTRIAEVAGRLGFQTPGYFSQVFRKNVGVSPRDWLRRRLRT